MLKNFFLGRYDPSDFPYGLEQNTKFVKRPLVFITRDSNQKWTVGRSEDLDDFTQVDNLLIIKL